MNNLWSHFMLYMYTKVLVVLHSEDPKSAVAGVWCTMFFIYMTYTLLALHIQVCFETFKIICGHIGIVSEGT